MDNASSVVVESDKSVIIPLLNKRPLHTQCLMQIQLSFLPIINTGEEYGRDFHLLNLYQLLFSYVHLRYYQCCSNIGLTLLNIFHNESDRRINLNQYHPLKNSIPGLMTKWWFQCHKFCNHICTWNRMLFEGCPGGVYYAIKSYWL